MTKLLPIAAGAIAAAAAFSAFASPAHAQNRNGTGNITHGAVIQQAGDGPQAASQSSAAGGSARVSVDASSRSRVAIAPALGGLSSGQCAGRSGGATAGFFGFSGGIQAGDLDPRCTARNTALALEAVGLLDEAQQVMLREYRIVMGEDAPAARPVASAPAGGTPVTSGTLPPTLARFSVAERTPATTSAFVFNNHNN